jgi:hypothetical protein
MHGRKISGVLVLVKYLEQRYKELDFVLKNWADMYKHIKQKNAVS